MRALDRKRRTAAVLRVLLADPVREWTFIDLSRKLGVGIAQDGVRELAARYWVAVSHREAVPDGPLVRFVRLTLTGREIGSTWLTAAR